MIRITNKGNFEKANKALLKLLGGDMYTDLDRYGREGVSALAKATPVETSLTANSWAYRVIKGKNPGIEWYNTNVVNGVSVAILIQYGHGTGTGGYVQGRNYINPAIRPIFDQIVANVRKKVKS